MGRGAHACATISVFVRFSKMIDTLKRLGAELRQHLAGSLKRPLNWNMIDALTKIEEAAEAEEAKLRREAADPTRLAPQDPSNNSKS